MHELAFVPAHELARRIRSRELSAREAVRACLDRIARFDGELRAFACLREREALAEAEAVDAAVARGDAVGPLGGVPFGVKDEQDVAGLPTTYGSVPFRTHVPERDSTLVARLRAAGAIPLGKTNMPEFGATAFTKNLLFGVTRNPWNTARTPGGSSGGSAAAVAAGLVPFATGGDGGGSIRIPASYTGLFGLKPTFGRISRAPFWFRDWVDTICKGPLTRSVRDAALFMDAVVGYDPLDPDSLPHPGYAYAEVLESVPRGLRIAYSPTLGYARVARMVSAVVEPAVERLGQVLERPIEVIDDHLTDGGLAWAMLNSFETHAKLGPMLEQHRDEWGRGFLKGLEFGAKVTAKQIGDHMRTRLRLITEVAAIFARYDLLVTPTLPTTAFDAKGPMPSDVDGVPFDSPIHPVAFSYPFNLTGHPACTVPAGLASDGLPVGLQLVADRGREDLLLRVAHAWETAYSFPAYPATPRSPA
ncbi:MAG TPA: amidase [Candidatus Limnocylindria bacterium]|nr:amidase [Candidatus Limnocylindria bacterium]